MKPSRSTGLGPLQVGIILLTLGTALTHMSLLFPDVVFILNGLGYLALLGALYLPRLGVLPHLEVMSWLAAHTGLVRWLLIGYTVLAIGLWLAFGLRAPIGYINKANELLLLALLLLEWRQEGAG